MVGNQINVLLIEDDPGDSALLTKALQRTNLNATLVWEQTLNAGIARLESERIDIVISDLSLPDCVGADIVSSIQEIARSTPVVVLTGLDDSNLAAQLIDCGAEEFLVKGDVTDTGLRRAISHSLQRHESNARIRNLLVEVEAQSELLQTKNAKLAKLYDQAHEFVDNVSHEFRTPLTVIKDYVALVREGLVGEVNPEQARLLNIAEDRANDLNTMVEDMLDVSKLESGLLGAWRKECEFKEITRYVADSLRRKAEVKNVRLTWQIADDLPAIYCDPEKASRVIMNLVMNAIKFCGNPGIVTISVIADHDSNEVRVAISDNGSGIDEQHLSIIFGRFQQLGQSVRSSTNGFGLGLNIARELVDLNFGQIDVESTVGQGSCFSFTIPFAEPLEILKRYLNQVARSDDSSTPTPEICIVEITTDEQERSDDIQHEMDAFLNCCLRKNDLLISTSGTQWFVILPEPESELSHYYRRVTDELKLVNRNRPFGPLPRVDMKLAAKFVIHGNLSAIVTCVSELIGIDENPVKYCDRDDAIYHDACGEAI